jgi:hypothetical protein
VGVKAALSEGFDVSLLGPCDAVVAHLAAALGWDSNEDGGEDGEEDGEEEAGVAAVGVGGGAAKAAGALVRTGDRVWAVEGLPAARLNPEDNRHGGATAGKKRARSPAAPAGAATGHGGAAANAEVAVAEVAVVEVVSCDACGERVGPPGGFQCTACLDFDLCAPCRDAGAATVAHTEATGHGLFRPFVR